MKKKILYEEEIFFTLFYLDLLAVMSKLKIANEKRKKKYIYKRQVSSFFLSIDFAVYRSECNSIL